MTSFGEGLFVGAQVTGEPQFRLLKSGTWKWELKSNNFRNYVLPNRMRTIIIVSEVILAARKQNKFFNFLKNV